MVSRRRLTVTAGVVLAGLLVHLAISAPAASTPSVSVSTRAGEAPARPGPASQPASAPAPSQGPSFWAGDKLDYRTREDLSLPWAQMAASILVLVVLGAAALLVTRKVLPRIRPAAGRTVRVIETTYVAPRQALHLVEVGQKRYLLAGTKDGLSLLSEVAGGFEEHVRRQLKPPEPEEPSA